MPSAEDIAHTLNVSGKSLRSWLRPQYPNREKGSPWWFSSEEADDIRRRWRSRDKSASTPTPAPRMGRSGARADSDEAYVLDLCDGILGERSSRQHRFPWLRGDQNRAGEAATLPVDAYYSNLQLVIEYRETQHYTATHFFDKPHRLTVSGVHRGEQRRLYDIRRGAEIPAHGLRLIAIDSRVLAIGRNGRLRRDADHDCSLLRTLLR